MINIVKNYFTSLSGGPPDYHRVDNTFLIMIGSVFAGYTATAFPEEVLKKFEHPIFQFIIFFVLGLSTSSSAGNDVYLYIIGDAIITTILFQLFVYLSKKYMNKKKNNSENTKQ